MRNIFLEKPYARCRGHIFPKPFSKKTKIEQISGSIAERFIQFVFIVCQFEDYRNIFKLNSRSLAFTSNKAFLKNKKGSETSLTALFSA